MSHNATSVTARVPGKVNLRLSVGPATDDGFHSLVNVFQAVSLWDEVEVTRRPPAPGPPGPLVRLRLLGRRPAGVPLDGSNLVVRAAELLARTAGVDTPVDIALRKSIPVAGGMAGGSADAAGALLACDALWGTGFGADGLARLGAELGSDVPFALLGGVAVGTGRGERLTPMPCRGDYNWLFALSDSGLSTAEVYRTFDRLTPAPAPPREDPELGRALAKADLQAVGAALANDLQPAALALRPDLDATLRAGRELGVLGAVVSGSGPTCAFLVAHRHVAWALQRALLDRGVCDRVVTAHGPVQGAHITP